MPDPRFGWSLPPGVTHAMIDAQAGGDEIAELVCEALERFMQDTLGTLASQDEPPEDFGSLVGALAEALTEEFGMRKFRGSADFAEGVADWATAYLKACKEADGCSETPTT